MPKCRKHDVGDLQREPGTDDVKRARTENLTSPRLAEESDDGLNHAVLRLYGFRARFARRWIIAADDESPGSTTIALSLYCSGTSTP